VTQVKGEIDIIEGVNNNNVNKFVLHTDTDCKVDGQDQTGTQLLTDCAYDGPSGASGCDVNDVRTSSFGSGLNVVGGGYYVMEWDGDAIRIWFFPRVSAPSSLIAGEPNTTEFGTPAANFEGDCDIDKRFQDQRFIFTNNFCGDWAGQVYAESGCPMYSGLDGMASCKKFVAENPAAFSNQYWRIRSFKTYQKKVVVSSSSHLLLVSLRKLPLTTDTRQATRRAMALLCPSRARARLVILRRSSLVRQRVLRLVVRSYSWVLLQCLRCNGKHHLLSLRLIAYCVVYNSRCFAGLSAPTTNQPSQIFTP
jgi:hypothetical protein